MSGGATPAALTHELLRWVSAAPRTYRDVVEAWVSNCPRHPVWDDAVSDGLVTVDGRSVLLTSGGRAALIREAEA